MENIANSFDSFPNSPIPHRRPRRFSINSNRCNASLINNKDEEEIIQGDALIVFDRDGRHFHGIVQGKHGLCQILGDRMSELHSPSTPEMLSSSSSDEDSEGKIISSPRIYSTDLFQNHFESKNLGSVEVLCLKDRCHMDSTEANLHFTSSNVFRGVKADKMITSTLGPSFVREGQVCYNGHIVIGVPMPPLHPIQCSSSQDSEIMEYFL